MGVGMARRQFNRSTKRRLGGFAQPLFSQRDAEILERVGILRIELRGPAERVERFIVLRLPDLENAEHGQTERVLRVRSQRPFQMVFRRGQPAQFDLGLRKVGENGDVFIIEPQRLRIFLLRSPVTPRRERPPGFGHQRPGRRRQRTGRFPVAPGIGSQSVQLQRLQQTKALR